MKDLVTVLFVLILGGGGAAGFFYWKNQKARAEEAAYEQAIDDAMDREIESFSLKPALDRVAPHQGAARLEALRALYADPGQGDRMEERFGPGSLDLMNAQYAQFLVEMPRRVAERDTQQQRDAQIFIRAMEDYRRRNGRYPPGGFRVVDGRVVEE